jgi:hypothetical protein
VSREVNLFALDDLQALEGPPGAGGAFMGINMIMTCTFRLMFTVMIRRRIESAPQLA